MSTTSYDITPVTQSVWLSIAANDWNHPQLYKAEDSAKHVCTVISDNNQDMLKWDYRHVIGLCSVLRPRRHSIGYMGDDFYRSKHPTNSIKVLKENLQRKNKTTQTTKYTHAYTKTDKTRNMGQSPTWGRPAPQVWLEIQFTGLVGCVKISGASAT